MLKFIFTILIILCSTNFALAGKSELKLLTCLGKEIKSPTFSNKKVIARYDSINNLSVRNITLTDLLKLQNDVNQYLAQNKRTSDILKLSVASLPLISDELGSDKEEIRQYIYLLNQLGTLSKGHGVYNLIFNYYINGYHIAQRYGMEEEKALLLNNIGSMYTEIKDYNKAIASFKQAIAINELLKQTERLFVNYNNLSAAYAYVKNFDKALEYAFLAVHQLKMPEQEELEMLMQRNICSIYSKKGMHQYALEEMGKVLNFQLKHGEEPYLSDTYRIIADLHASLNQDALAIAAYRNALNYATKFGDLTQKVELLKSLSKISFKSGDANSAFQYLKESNAIKDTLELRDNSSQIKLLLDLYSIEQNQFEDAKNEKTTILAKSYTWAGVLIFIIVVLCVYIFIQHRRNIKRINTISTPKDTEKIAELENNVKQYEAKILTLSIQQQYDNDFREQLSDNLKQLLLRINPKSTATKAQISDILSEINRYGSNSELNLFNEIFEKIHPGFYENINKQFGNLTAKELRLCAMLRLGFSTKSIASITFRETRSVESARNRLRKKFNLQQQDDLINFLMRF